MVFHHLEPLSVGVRLPFLCQALLLYLKQSICLFNYYITFWQQTTGMPHVKLLLGGYNLARFRAMIILPGTSSGSGALHWHCRLKKHLSNVSVDSCGTCRFCYMDPETPEHLILNCTAICRHRLKTLGSIYVHRDSLPQ